MAGATRSYEFARRLVAGGHEVHMITSDRSANQVSPNRWRTETIAGIFVHWVNVPYSNKLPFTKRVWAFLLFALLSARRAASLDGDILFATSTPLTIAIPAVYARKRTKTPMVFEVRDLWPAVPIALGIIRSPVLKWFSRRLESVAYRNASHIIALAPGMKDEIAATGFPANRITVIPNGCDLELFADGDAAVVELRARYEWLGDRPLVSYVGTLGRINAVDYLVEIARAAGELDERIRFAVVGTGIEESNIRELARKVGVYEKNFFMIGVLPKREAVQWVNASTMTIALVRGPKFIWKDATQNKYFDSLAAGKPVASNYDGWQAQVASQAGAGIILDPANYQDAALTLVRAVTDKRWLETASEAAIRLAKRCYSRDAQAIELEDILQRVAAGSGDDT